MKIDIKNLSYGYSKKKELVLKDITRTFVSGNIYILGGKNGSGKTTLSKLIMGLIKPKKNQIFIDDVDITKLDSGQISKKIGYLFQIVDLQLFAPTVIEELVFPYQLTNTFDDKAKVRIKKTLEKLELVGMEKRFPLTMSGGEKQRLALATILLRDIKFMILDEPTASIDNEGKEFVANLIREFTDNGGGVIVISHDKEFIEKLGENTTKLLLEGALLCQN
ncbi:MAG: ABC transporter ATP-binding protein [Clostridia bacterium]